MICQADFGRRLKEFRKIKNFTQKEVAVGIGVSEQAVSKWENGECLPDVYNLKLLGQFLHVSIDYLLSDENDKIERVVDVIKIGGANFEIVEKPEMILAGKIIYAKDYEDISGFDDAIGEVSDAEKQIIYKLLKEPVLPVFDINLSVNFWREEKYRAYGFVRQVTTEQQPEGADVYKIPSSLYIRAYTNKATAQLIAKEQCEVWELFAYIRNFLMPTHGFKMAQNGAQELEVFDTFEHKSGYAYMPVVRG